MPECTCRGGNSNCFKCGGWGWVGDSISEHRNRPSSAQLSEETSIKKRKKKKKRAWPLPVGIETKTRKKKKEITCPCCLNKVVDLFYHVRIYHPARWLEYIENQGEMRYLETVNKTGTTIKKVTCPYCSKKVKNLLHHVSMLRHVSIYHPKKWKKFTENQDIRMHLIESGLTRCEKCGALVEKLKRHLKRSHRNDLQNIQQK